MMVLQIVYPQFLRIYRMIRLHNEHLQFPYSVLFLVCCLNLLPVDDKHHCYTGYLHPLIEVLDHWHQYFMHTMLIIIYITPFILIAVFRMFATYPSFMYALIHREIIFLESTTHVLEKKEECAITPRTFKSLLSFLISIFKGLKIKISLITALILNPGWAITTTDTASFITIFMHLFYNIIWLIGLRIKWIYPNGAHIYSLR